MTDTLEVAIAHARAGRHDEAERALKRLIEAAPTVAVLHAELGAVLALTNRLAEAEISYREALRLQPSFGVVHHNLGNALRDLGRLGEAETSYRRATELLPRVPEAHYNLAIVLRALGRLEEAERSLARAIECWPAYAEAHNNRGVVLAELGRLEEAEQSYRRALEAKPDHAAAYSNLGNVQRQRGRIEEAERSYRRALDLRPDLAAAHNHLGNTLRDLGFLDDAERSYRRALELDPSSASAHSNLLFLLNYIPGRLAADIFAEHAAYGRRFRARAPVTRYDTVADPDRRLRVGYVSADLRDHAVAYFIEPVLAGHRCGNCDAVCYFNGLREDAVTERLRGLAHKWREIVFLDDAAVEQVIRNDGIDVLVDLSGHTAGNRLPLFARLPAPVQATWLGYLNTTGMASIGYRITDAVATPKGPLDGLNTEKLIRLPDSQWCYQPPADCPPASQLSPRAGESVRLGVFTTPPKISDAMIALWRELLDCMPGATLLVVLAIVANPPEGLRLRFHRLGIGPERLTLLGAQSFRRYLELHRLVDLMLDTWPYTGGTTTCHALWMGVPTVTRAGETATSRGGASILSAVGLCDLIAHNDRDYVRIAVALAQNEDRRVELRGALRDRMASSPLMDSARFTSNLESAYRSMWTAWCEGGNR